jgi:hypothetical protein
LQQQVELLHPQQEELELELEQLVGQLRLDLQM